MNLEDLRAANIARKKLWQGDERLDLTYKMLELIGEAGELANEIKKLHRIDNHIQGTTETKAQIMQNIEDEAGDVLICLDLLLIDLKIDLATATKNKFNKTSIKHNMKTRI